MQAMLSNCKSNPVEEPPNEACSALAASFDYAKGQACRYEGQIPDEPIGDKFALAYLPGCVSFRICALQQCSRRRCADLGTGQKKNIPWSSGARPTCPARIYKVSKSAIRMNQQRRCRQADLRTRVPRYAGRSKVRHACGWDLLAVRIKTDNLRDLLSYHDYHSRPEWEAGPSAVCCNAERRTKCREQVLPVEREGGWYAPVVLLPSFLDHNCTSHSNYLPSC